jgi:hypothetical protein
MSPCLFLQDGFVRELKPSNRASFPSGTTLFAESAARFCARASAELSQKRTETRNLSGILSVGNMAVSPTLQDGLVRELLLNVLKNEPDVIVREGHTDEEGVREASEGMRSAKFCLHPGKSPKTLNP